MNFESADDLDEMFSDDDFAVEAIFTAAALSHKLTVLGIFDNGYSSLETGNLEVAGQDPNFTVPTSKISDIAQDDTVIINSINYTIIGLEPDGTGVTRIDLNRV